jgi:alpha-tubulin suppressor-like RCC1 family protein
MNFIKRCLLERRQAFRSGGLALLVSAGLLSVAPWARAQYQVVAWGVNNHGQTNVPPNLTNAIAIAGGWHHSAALRADGTVVVWGDNNAGQTNVPAGLTNVIAISSRSGDNVTALRVDGTVVAWGDNSYGQTNVPAGLRNVVAIAQGATYGLALKADGTVASWGEWSGLPGTPMAPAGLSNVVALAAGDTFTLFLKADGTIASYYELPPSGLDDVIDIAAGFLQGLVLQANGTLTPWGWFLVSEEMPGGPATVPAGLTNVAAIQSGDSHWLFLKPDGTVTVWGYYTYNDETYVWAPPAPALANVEAIAAGSNHDLAMVRTNGSPPSFQLAALGWGPGGFTLSLPTQSGRVYRLEYKNALTDSAWTALPLVPGNGGVQALNDPTATGAQRFYRVSRW